MVRSGDPGVESKRLPLSGVVMVACAAGSWGLWSLFLRSTSLPGTVTSTLMLGFVGLFALPLALAEPRPRWDRTTVLLLLALALADAFNMLTFFAALDHTSVAVAVLTHYLAPVIIAVAAPAIDRVVTPGARGAALVALLGLVLLLELPWRGFDGGATDTWTGAALGASSAVGYAGFIFIIRRLGPRIGPARALSYHGLIGALALLPVAAGGLSVASLHDIGLMAVGSLLLGVVAGLTFIAGLARLGSARAAVLTFAEPMVAVVVGFVAFGESLSAGGLVGMALMMGTGIWVSWAPDRRLAAPD